ncbi:MAG: site-specific DNA-methyltransferase, partial [Actinomycetota bacterium]|nr:site-specific DNA-methyltransferase [Actinomycetota bacterium]
PEVSDDTALNPPTERDVLHHHDARDMSRVATASVALVVTSPPYFAGKEYEEGLGRGGVPATYVEYLALLEEVFAECRRVLEPGGRIAVNVANLGRRPYRSLAGDVTDILQGLGLLLRGEVVWWKGRAAGGSCAWGSFQRPANPVLRDVTERIVIAGKGRFDRAVAPRRRRQRSLPSTATITRDEFLDATTDLWELAPESATRVGHPAPFPVALPTRLIQLYTYEGDLVLDPFMGVGTTAVAAVRTGRHYVGFETDAGYVGRARLRLAAEALPVTGSKRAAVRVQVPAAPAEPAGNDGEDRVRRALRDGRSAKDVAEIVLEDCGFVDIRSGVKLTDLGVELAFTAADRTGSRWAFDLSGAFAATRAGLKRSDALWKALGTAAVLHWAAIDLPLVLLTTDAPARASAGMLALEAVTGPDRPVRDVVELLDPAGHARLRTYAAQGRSESRR